MNLLTSLALLGFVSRALAHAQLLLLAEMQQENSTNDGRSHLPFGGSKVTIDDEVSTEFTIANDEDIPGGKSTSTTANEVALLARRNLVDFVTALPSYPSSIPSGATELPGLHGRTPLIWKWDQSVTKATKPATKNRRGERKSNDFPSPAHDCNSSPKNLGERSSKSDDDDTGPNNSRDEMYEDDIFDRRTSLENVRRNPSMSSSQRNNNNNISRTSKNRSGNGHRRRTTDEDINYDDDDQLNGQGRNGNGRKNRKQNRRRRVHGNNSGRGNNNNDNDGQFTEEDDEIVGQVDDGSDEIVDIDQSRDSDSDYDGQDEVDEGQDESTSGESSRRGSNGRRNRNNKKKNYGARRLQHGFAVDGQVPLPQESLNKPYPKRPSDMVVPDLSNKPYPKESSSSGSPSSNPRRRFKVLQRPYSAPYPGGFPSAIRPSDESSKSTIWTSGNPSASPASAFVISNSGDNADSEAVDFGDSIDQSSLEDGATLLDTLTGQTYEISLDSSSRSSPLLAALVTDSVVQPGASFLTKSPVIRTPGESIDSVLASLLIPSNQPPSGLSFIEPIAA